MAHNGYLLFGNFDFDVIKSSAKNFSASANSLDLVYSSTPTSRFHVVVASRAGADGNAASAVSQSGVTWTRVSNVSNSGAILDMWLGQGIASSDTVTVSYSATTPVCAIAAELGAFYIVDVDSPTNTGTGTTASTSGAGTLRAQRYSLAAAATDRGDRTFSAPTNGYTLHDQTASGGGGANSSLVLCYKKVSGNPSTVSLTISGTCDWAALMKAM
jgi:hypothetical protein